METTTTESTTKDKSNNDNSNNKATPVYLKFIGFGFYIFQLVVVLCSWRVYFLFTDSYSNSSNSNIDNSNNNHNTNNNNSNNNNNNSNNNSDQQSTNVVKQTPLTFKEKVQYNFSCLFTDSFYLIMILVTFTLFFWRAKPLYCQLKQSDTNKWKSIIWEEFWDGGIEFGSFTVLLLLKWPVIFKVFWYKGTEKEDKSTWAEIFLREFTPKDKQADDSGSSGNASSGGVGSDQARKTLSDDQWKKQFQMDLQNIGFEFGPTGEVTKFPPTEVMEQYQKSNRFRDLILQAGPSKSSDNDPKIEDYVESQQHQQQSQSQSQSNNKKVTNRKTKNKK